MYISVSAMGQLPSPPAKWNKSWHPTDTSAPLQTTIHWHFSSVTEHHPLTLQLRYRAPSTDTSALLQSTIHWHFSSVTDHHPLTLQLCYRAPSTDTSALLQTTIHWHQLCYRPPWYRAPWYHLQTLTHFLCLMRLRYFCMVMPTCTSTARWCNSCNCSAVTAHAHTHTHTQSTVSQFKWGSLHRGSLTCLHLSFFRYTLIGGNSKADANPGSFWQTF